MAAEQTPSDVRARLHAISERLRELHHLGPETQREVAELVEEMGKALGAAPVPSPELAHLTDSAAHLLHSLQEQHDTNVLTAARERLDKAILGAESQAPFVAG